MKSLEEKIKEEINKTTMELTMGHTNDGWWNNFMKKKLEELKQKLQELQNDNGRI